MMLVAGGTGRLGTLVVSQLVEKGFEVRVLTRDPARAAHLTGVATEIATGDVRDRASIERTMDQVRTVVSAVHGFAGPGHVTPASIDRDGNANLVDSAAAAGADVVLMSVVGASADSPMELFRAKHDAEEHLRTSGAPWTIVRSTAFVELWAEIMRKPIVFGRGDNPINFVSVHDVAAVVVRAAIDPNVRGQILEVGGPQNVTFNELAMLLQQARGTGGKIRHVPRSVLRALAPFGRQPRAAITMDTADMRFDVTGRTDLPLTELGTALSRVASGPHPKA
ncbi:MAG TPA: NAD(P)H-binding protein [Acidimicrobiia bacterium]|jgi:NADH dehydrogenase|nr:NAD(P)H-binding protein [Acidimicrobiia bacterium]